MANSHAIDLKSWHNHTDAGCHEQNGVQESTTRKDSGFFVEYDDCVYLVTEIDGQRKYERGLTGEDVARMLGIRVGTMTVLWTIFVMQPV